MTDPEFKLMGAYDGVFQWLKWQIAAMAKSGRINSTAYREAVYMRDQVEAAERAVRNERGALQHAQKEARV